MPTLSETDATRLIIIERRNGTNETITVAIWDLDPVEQRRYEENGSVAMSILEHTYKRTFTHPHNR